MSSTSDIILSKISDGIANLNIAYGLFLMLASAFIIIYIIIKIKK